jgi:mRNA interferase MazF
MPRPRLRVAATEAPRVRPWQVWEINFDPQVGHEQGGRRPGIVVGSRFACDAVRGLLIVVPCTTTPRGLTYRPRVNIARPSIALVDHVKSISTDRLVRLLPVTLSDEEIGEVRFALRRMFA